MIFQVCCLYTLRLGRKNLVRIRSTSQAALANLIQYQFSFSYREYKFPTNRFQSRKAVELVEQFGCSYTAVYLSIRPCSTQFHILNIVRNFFILILR